ncbi:MAG: serine hydrolase domain-containing protein [Candidatus Hermodarchaeota archaeon]
MSRTNKSGIRKIGLPLLIITFGLAAGFPGALLIFRINSDEYWTIITPELVRMDSSVLDNMIFDVENNYYGVYSILVIRNGFIVKEWYDIFASREYLFRLYSVSKSVTSILVGIALDKGYISSLDELVLDYFPDKDIANLDSQKESITIEHLLTMTTGLHWPEYYPYEHPQNPYHDWKASEDHVEYVLNRTMIATPGETFNYNTGATHLLSAIVQRATNMSTVDFAEQYLFEPLGIERFNWLEDPQGVACGGDGLFLKTRDMGKLGYLFLKGGKWGTNQIISESWVRTSTSPLIYLGLNSGYGYQWWVNPNSNRYRALGYGGQQINVYYTRDLIIMFTGMNLNFDFSSYLIDNYILPALL